MTIIPKIWNKEPDDKYNTPEDRAPNIAANYTETRIYNYNPNDKTNEIKLNNIISYLTFNFHF